MIDANNKRTLLWAAIAVSLGIGQQCFAQTGGEPVEASDDLGDNILEVVVVRAERRENNLQTTPIAATVIDGDDLLKLGVNVIDQLQFTTPSAVVNNFGQGINFNIRGIGKGETNTQTLTGVITYRDGVATFPGYIAGEPYYDIASVEILRGPQGTFVGQNATGGAVFVTTNNPVIDGGYRGYIQGSVSNYSGFGLQTALNIPISDTLAARIAYTGETRDSFWDIEGPYTGDDGIDKQAARVGLLWEPNSALSVLWKTEYGYLDLSAYPADPATATNDPFSITSNADHQGRDRYTRSVIQVDYEFENQVKLRSVTGYQDGNTLYSTDLDGTALLNFTFEDYVEERIYSQEFNLISPVTGNLSWVLGAYYQYDKYYFEDFLTGVPAGNVLTEYRLNGTNPKDTKAVFGHMGYFFNDSLELEIGARYTEYETTNDVDILQFGLPLVSEETASYDNLSGKVAINWSVNSDHFLYAFLATGFRPGGLNVPVSPLPQFAPTPFEEELVKSFEMGWKAEWLGGRLRTQMTGFYNDYENFQVRIGFPDNPVFAIELNTPDATQIYGFEAQAQAQVGDFGFNFGLGYTNSELGTFFATDPRIAGIPGAPCLPESGPASATCISLEGREQTYAPELTFNAGMEYSFFVNSWRITPRINYAHIDEQWGTLFQNEALGDLLGERDIFSGQIAMQAGEWLTTLYATNLTDETYIGAVNAGLRFAGPPRQFGIRVTRAF